MRKKLTFFVCREKNGVKCPALSASKGTQMKLIECDLYRIQFPVQLSDSVICR